MATPTASKKINSTFSVLKAACTVALSLTLALALLPLITTAAFGNEVDLPSREEVIYGTLSADGKVEGLYAVSTITTTPNTTLTDYGTFSSVVNLTNANAIALSPNSISATTDTERFSYQGNLVSQQLPWNITLNYTLDGSSIAPEKLAGATGELEFALSLHNNTGELGFTQKNTPFFDNYMLQVTVVLDPDQASSVSSETATVVLAGGQRVLNFTILPNNDAVHTFTAQVSDFELASIEIVAVPFSLAFDMPDASETTDGFQDLVNAIELLESGAGDLEEGAQTLSSNMSKIVDGSSKINDALGLLNSGLSQSGSFGFDQLSKLPGVLEDIADGLDGVVSNITPLATSFSTAKLGLEAALGNLPDKSDALDAEVQAYFMSDPTNPALQAMYQSYVAGTGLKVAYYASMQAAFVAADTTLAGLPEALGEVSSGLHTIAAALPSENTLNDFSDQLDTLQSSVKTLATSYKSFHGGLVNFDKGLASYNKGVQSYTSGTTSLRIETADLPTKVQDQIEEFMADYQPADFEPVSFISSHNKNTESVQFVLRTARIELPKEPPAPAVLEEDPSFLERLLALFGL
ncbi:MAG: hypothetical protein LBB42_00170 [Coriobacteriales bacterium]|nr:hypothetical protein [Coriobacteriales bacterium]